MVFNEDLQFHILGNDHPSRGGNHLVANNTINKSTVVLKP